MVQVHLSQPHWTQLNRKVQLGFLLSLIFYLQNTFLIAVARLIKEECIKSNESQEYVEDMFTLGMLHDVGYEFGERSEHP